MGKVSLAEKHVDILQKEALGNLRLRMDEVGTCVKIILVTGMPVAMRLLKLVSLIGSCLSEFSRASDNQSNDALRVCEG